jgi:hypothetical protein
MYRVSHKHAVIGLVAMLTLVLSACCRPSFGRTTTEFKTGSYNAAYESDIAQSSVSIGLPFEALTVGALDADSANLVEADLEYVGEIVFASSGAANRRITLSEDMDSISYRGHEQLDWAVRLRRDVPTGLSLNVSSGSATADLGDLIITGLDVNVSSGTVDVTLPANPDGMVLALDVSSGSLDVAIPTGAAVTFDRVSISSGRIGVEVGDGVAFAAEVNVSSGLLAFDVPADAPVRVRANVSSGTVQVPADYVKVSGEANSASGVYESPAFAGAEAAARIVLTVQVSSGTFRVE